MTQGYGNQESAAETEAAKRDAKDKPAAPKPEAGRNDAKDVATPGDGAGPSETPGKDVDPGVG